MQKKLIALAVASLVSAPAFAQSNVTVGGVIDQAIQIGDWANSGGNVTRMVSGGNTTNRLFFKGTEDLGNGLAANFHLEHQPNPDQGNWASGNFWHRTATVGLSSKSWGRVDFGRQYSPWFSVRAANDIFYTAGVGSNYNIEGALTRISNSMRYASPSFNGFTFGASYSFGNQIAGVTSDVGDESTVDGQKSLGREMGLQLGYANGPLKLAYAYDKQRITVNNAVLATIEGDKKLNHLNGSYDFKVVKVVAGWNSQKQDASAAGGAAVSDQNSWYIGAVMPVFGKDLVKVEYTRINDKIRRANAAGVLDSADGNMIALGYEHPMSKRTVLYGTYAKMNNDAGGSRSLLGGVGVAAGFDPSAWEFGLKHSF